MNVKKRDLIDQVMIKIERQGLSLGKKDVAKIITMFLNILENSIISKKEDKIQLSGFGTFYIKKRKPRLGRNPKTKEEYKIPERYSVSFKPSQNFVLFVNHKKRK